MPSRRQSTVITMEDGLLLRGLAIVVILLHNFLHWIDGAPEENEFGFTMSRVERFFEVMRIDPSGGLSHLLSYYGHYGVQIFFFLSAYGLYRSYSGRSVDYWAFQRKRWLSLYPALVLAALMYLFYASWRVGFGQTMEDDFLNLLWQMSGLANFMPGKVYAPVGPWWFISVMLQFYLLAPWLIREVARRDTSFLYGLIGGSWLVELALGGVMYKTTGLNINHTVIGHLDCLALGFLWASKKEIVWSWPRISLVLALFLVSSLGWLWKEFWVSSGLWFLLVVIPVFQQVKPRLAKLPIIGKWLAFSGGVSLYLFLCNGFLRRPLIDWINESPSDLRIIVATSGFLVLTYMVALILRFFDQRWAQLREKRALS